MHNRKIWWFLGGAVLLAILVVVAVSLMGGQQSATAPTEIAITGTAERASLQPTIHATAPAPQKSEAQKQLFQVQCPAVSGTPNPAAMRTVGDQLACGLVFEPLARRNVDGSMGAVLAEQFALSKNGTSLTITLKEGIQFQNAEPVKAEDVAASIMLACFHGNQLCDNLSGKAAFQENELLGIAGIKVIDDRTLTLTFDNAGVENLHILEIPVQYAGAFTQEGRLAYELTVGEDYTPVGTGPFALKSVSDGTAVFTATEDPRFSRGNVREVVLSPDKTEAPDAVFFPQGANVFQQDEENAALNIYAIPDNRLLALRYNFQRPLLQEETLRQAIAMTVDRNALLAGETALAFSPQAGIFTAGNVNSSKQTTKRDIARAKTLVETLKEEHDMGEIKLRIPVVADDTLHKQIALALKAQLAEINLTLEITELSRKEFINYLYMQNGFDLCLEGYFVSESYGSLRALLDPESGLPVLPTGYNAQEVIEDILAEVSAGETAAAMQSIEKTMLDQNLLLVLGTGTSYLGVSADRGQYRVTPYGEKLQQVWSVR